MVGRFFDNLKQWRGLAARFDKLVVVYRAGLVTVAVVMWLRRLLNTP
ncbi:transposase [Corynebacterium halotolerans]|uniref:Transposase-like protein n=1 Tax=Corynebacterium halotolerans YIM 70093 = DSM 44683 TaxID=1121362 RepID=M1P046_9CORY|nr:transposase [Corynebacterium halotolerans]AGF73145.1 transposase-like protein [Corynebacterium halotolerans YIM 70093 = DSM 44683]